MSENPETPKYLSIDELGKLKLTADEANLLKLLHKFVGDKKKAKKSKPSGSAKKKTEIAIRLGRTINAVDAAKTKVLALPVETQQKTAIDNRANLREAMAGLMKQENFDYKNVVKVFKAAGTVMADMPPPPKPEKKAKAPEAPTPSAN